MERTKTNTENITIAVQPTTPVSDGKIRWKKVGGGSLRIFNKIIKPGEIFSARVDEIPKAFRDIVIPMSPIPEASDEPIKAPAVKYTMELKGDSKTLYNIINPEGKVMNEKGLKKEVAEQLIKDLEK